MSNKDAPHISADRDIDDVINDAVIKFKNNESIENCLLEINGDEDKFNRWASDMELGEKDYVLLESVDMISDIFDTFEADGMDLKSDADTLNFMASMNEYIEDWQSAIYYKIGDICVGVRCDIYGQKGPHFFDFGIYSSKEQYFKSLADAGYICFLDGTVVSHSSSDLISMFKENGTERHSAN